MSCCSGDNLSIACWISVRSIFVCYTADLPNPQRRSPNTTRTPRSQDRDRLRITTRQQSRCVLEPAPSQRHQSLCRLRGRVRPFPCVAALARNRRFLQLPKESVPSSGARNRFGLRDLRLGSTHPSTSEYTPFHSKVPPQPALGRFESACCSMRERRPWPASAAVSPRRARLRSAPRRQTPSRPARPPTARPGPCGCVRA